MMTYEEFRNLVRDMRAAQIVYFKYRLSDHLQQSKDLERQVDAELKPQQQEPGLFATDEERHEPTH